MTKNMDITLQKRHIGIAFRLPQPIYDAMPMVWATLALAAILIAMAAWSGLALIVGIGCLYWYMHIGLARIRSMWD